MICELTRHDPDEARSDHARAARDAPPDAAPVRPRLLQRRLGLGPQLPAVLRRTGLRGACLEPARARSERGSGAPAVLPLAGLRRRPGAGGLGLAPPTGLDRPFDGRDDRAEGPAPAAGPRHGPDGPRSAAWPAR